MNGSNIYPRQIGKKDLVGQLQVILQTGRIKIAPGLDHADTLLGELANFRIRPVTVADPIADWRVGPQNDLVLAVAIVVWDGKSQQRISACSNGRRLRYSAGKV